jgi:uncharacterized protein DUF4112
VIGALRHRVPLRHIVRMVVNILLDLAIGEIPILGDIFDIAFEENVMNLKLLLKHRDRGRPPRSFFAIGFASALVLFVIAAAAFGAVALLIAFAVWLANQR